MKGRSHWGMGDIPQRVGERAILSSLFSLDKMAGYEWNEGKTGKTSVLKTPKHCKRQQAFCSGEKSTVNMKEQEI